MPRLRTKKPSDHHKHCADSGQRLRTVIQIAVAAFENNWVERSDPSQRFGLHVAFESRDAFTLVTYDVGIEINAVQACFDARMLLDEGQHHIQISPILVLRWERGLGRQGESQQQGGSFFHTGVPAVSVGLSGTVNPWSAVQPSV